MNRGHHENRGQNRGHLSHGQKNRIKVYPETLILLGFKN